MNLWLVIPVKPLNESKSRLAVVLSPQERATLIQQLFTDVLRTALSVKLLAGIVVISRDQDVLAQAAEAGAFPLQEQRDGLNQALTQATQKVIEWGADAMLVLPADLPLITSQDIIHLYRSSPIEAGIVIAPSQDGGTNALLIQPPGVIDFAFGINSFQHHCDAAKEAGITCQAFESDRFAFDVDLPEDLLRWQSLQQAQGASRHKQLSNSAR